MARVGKKRETLTRYCCILETLVWLAVRSMVVGLSFEFAWEQMIS